MEVQDGTNLFVNPAERNWQPNQIGYTVRDIQNAMGFENPQAVYKWISGKCLPSLDNFLILSRLLNTSIEDILAIDGDIPRFRIILNYTQRWQESLHRLR